MDFTEIFTPSRPPIHMNFLVGRNKELDDLKYYLKSSGTHPIIVGARGIGKTSLVQAISEFYPNFIQIEANTVENFDELSRCICDDLGIDINLIKTTNEEMLEGSVGTDVKIFKGDIKTGEKTSEERMGFSNQPVSPQKLKRLLQKINKSAIISIDELDDVPLNSDLKIRLAKFTKSISNQSKWFDHHLILSGIGKDAHSLFGNHLSINRNLPVIYLKRLTKNDFLHFLTEAEKYLKIFIPNSIKNEMASDADGFPYYIHQVGYFMFREYFKEKNGNSITEHHYKNGQNKAFEAAFSYYLNKYKFTIYTLTKLELEILRQVILSRGTYINKQVLLTKIQYQREEDTEKIKETVNGLIKPKGYLNFRKSDENISLAEPLLKPFLKIKLKIKENDRQQLTIF